MRISSAWMRRSKRTFTIASLIATLGIALVELGIITNIYLKWFIFGALVISAIGNLVVTIRINRREAYENAASVITKLLNLGCQFLQLETGIPFRACIFKPDNKKTTLEMQFYSVEFKKYPKERLLKWEKRQGVVGHVWASGKPLLGNLQLPQAKNGAPWGLTPEQITLTKDIKAVVGLPIYVTDNNIFYGVLSFDTLCSPPPEIFTPNNKYISAMNMIKEQIEAMLTTYIEEQTIENVR